MGYYTNFSIDIRTAITRAEAKDIAAAINQTICPFAKTEDNWLFSLDDYPALKMMKKPLGNLLLMMR